MSGKLIIVSAPSGAGKTSVVKRLMQAELNLEFSVSATSRAPRPGEIHGKDYFFIPVEEFRAKIDRDELLEWQEVYPNQYYGTLKSEVERIWNGGHHVLFDVDVMGGMNLKKMYPEISLSLFIMPPSIKVLEQRLRHRSTETEESLRKRLDKAGKEIGFAGHFDMTIVNDILEQAVAKAIETVSKFVRI
ncbi:MAG TPA: guanylate kinase [Bacteroidales bacterium]|nr:guanylate kinase [Bacteroidales bacterium]HPI84931.1 guanylate kinase [Bacteroidales bacterium]HPM92463.1 guanylate kinase [Bacteroidales bacterium]